jgi:hydrophobic/amphiphilic exporter-1 (mainly G- bacteria), HAE1 family
VAVVGGLFVSQILTLFITPVIFLYIEDLSQNLSRFAKRAFSRGRVEDTQSAAEGMGRSGL